MDLIPLPAAPGSPLSPLAPVAPLSPLISVQEYLLGSVESACVKSVYWPIYNLLVESDTENPFWPSALFA